KSVVDGDLYWLQKIGQDISTQEVWGEKPRSIGSTLLMRVSPTLNGVLLFNFYLNTLTLEVK
ncbi:MAG: hypothetical protein AAF135_23335, partial [Bacteroidota bacterium]